ncbi:hypothetical protein FO519_004055 [Halicephalobus sp. NKZ332]|nr:hypothetical protein FO519_004055 [Halicephalobus sp. NKZ332]
MNVQEFPSSSGSRFPPAVFQEFIPAAMRQHRPRVPRPGFFQERSPRFYYSRPLAPQQMLPRVPRFAPRMNLYRPPGLVDFVPPKPLENENLKNCICERPEMMIICQRCGSELFGRIQRTCPAHPNSIQLMDHGECPNKFCKSIQLVEVTTTEENRS